MLAHIGIFIAGVVSGIFMLIVGIRMQGGF